MTPGAEIVALKDGAGKTHKLSDYEGHIVVLEWTNPQCPFVKHHYKENTMTQLAAKYEEAEVVWFAVDSSNFVTAESAAKWAKAEDIGYPILLDPAGNVGRMYHAKTTPHMFVIGTDGTLLYNGAIDSDPRLGDNPEHNYVDEAVSATLSTGDPSPAR